MASRITPELRLRIREKNRYWKQPLWRFLKWLGESWKAAPHRRIVQVVCLLAFSYFFFVVVYPYTDVFEPDRLQRLEVVPAELFLVLDPLVTVSTAIAARSAEWPLIFAVGILAFCWLFPRMFCGYLCPLGTLIDLFDWAIGKRVKRFKIPLPKPGQADGWWVHIKYYLLAGILVASLFGILLSGFFAAIPVITRGFMFILAPLQVGPLAGWHEVQPLLWHHWLSIGLFLGVLLLGLMRKRFWCRYVCPSGAMFSFFNLLRGGERKVESSCIHCNKCIEICPFDAIKPDFTTRTLDCTFCTSCAGVCPTDAIKFVTRWDAKQLKAENDPPVSEVPMSRRGFIAAGVAAGVLSTLRSNAFGAEHPKVLRPPGSPPEDIFLDLCIRCGECYKSCPGGVLQPGGLEAGFEGLWAPLVVPTVAGCHQECNFCGQVCPTGAIRPLSLKEKEKAYIGTAVIDANTCLPMAEGESCDYCVQECDAAGYNAIKWKVVDNPRFADVPAEEREQMEMDPAFAEELLIRIPVVDPDLCTGCGLCEYRCNAVYHKKTSEEYRPKWERPAIYVVNEVFEKIDDERVRVGGERRLHTGSYIDYHNSQMAEKKKRKQLAETTG